MHIGHYISGTAHAALIGWVLFGGVFRSEPEPAVITGVEMISPEAFERLLQADRPPSPETDVETPAAPELAEAAPERPQAETPPDPVEPPVETTEVTPDETPERLPEPLQRPQPAPDTPEPPESPDLAEDTAGAPEFSPRPTSRPVRRVAPNAVTAPSPEAPASDALAEATRPDEQAEAPAPDERAAALEEAAEEIPTEPQARDAAPTKSLRPRLRSRPPEPTRTATAEPEAESPPNATSDSVNAALAEALADTPVTPSGPPLTQGEQDAFRVAVEQCWVVDVGSQAAQVTVVLGLSLDRRGKVVPGSLQMIHSEGGDGAAARAAFEAARRAVLRCERGGYKLPIDKYEHWRGIELTFNPKKMRSR